MLIFCPYNVHFLHGREKVGNRVVGPRPLSGRGTKSFFSAFPSFWGGGVGCVFLLEVQYSILKSLISTCVLSYVGSREDWLLDRICES